MFRFSGMAFRLCQIVWHVRAARGMQHHRPSILGRDAVSHIRIKRPTTASNACFAEELFGAGSQTRSLPNQALVLSVAAA